MHHRSHPSRVELVARETTATRLDPATASEELSAPTPGTTPGTWFAALSFVAWLGALLVLMARGIDPQGRWRRGVAARAGLASLVFLPVWMWLTARG